MSKSKFIFGIVPVLFLVLMLAPEVSVAASEERSAGTCVNVNQGGVDWVNPNRAEVSDNMYAVGSTDFDTAPVREDYIYLSFTGSYTGQSENKWVAGVSFNTVEETNVTGGSTDDWNMVLTEDRVNNVDFAVLLSSVGDGYSGYTDQLKCDNFGFSVASGSTIDGISVAVDRKSVDNGGVGEAYIDHVRMTVYYTEAAGSSGATLSGSTLSGTVLTWLNLDCVEEAVSGSYCDSYDVSISFASIQFFMNFTLFCVVTGLVVLFLLAVIYSMLRSLIMWFIRTFLYKR